MCFHVQFFPSIITLPLPLPRSTAPQQAIPCQPGIYFWSLLSFLLKGRTDGSHAGGQSWADRHGEGPAGLWGWCQHPGWWGLHRPDVCQWAWARGDREAAVGPAGLQWPPGGQRKPSPLGLHARGLQGRGEGAPLVLLGRGKEHILLECP